MSDLLAGLPLILVAAASLVTLLVAAFRPRDRAVGQGVLMLLVFALIGAVIAGWDHSATNPRLLWNGMVRFDLYTLFFTVIVGIMLLGAVALSAGARGAEEYAHGEFWPLLALSASGMLLLASAANLIVLFLGVELMSIPVYCLVASDRG